MYLSPENSTFARNRNRNRVVSNDDFAEMAFHRHRSPKIGMKRSADSAKVSKKDKSRATSHFNVANVLKLLFSMVCFGGCGYQTINILSIYFNFQVTVKVTIVPSENIALPGITLCSSIGYKLSDLLKTPELKANYAKANRSSHNGNAEFAKLQKLVDKALREEMKKNTIGNYTRHGLTFKEFIDTNYTKCACDELNGTRRCNDYADVTVTAQNNGMCFTLFHASDKSQMVQYEVKAGLSQSAVLESDALDEAPIVVELSEMPLQPNEVIRLKINFSSRESTALNEPVYGSVTIHDPTKIPVTRSGGYTIQPGYYYLFYIEESKAKLLEAPYRAKCYNYTKYNKPRYKGPKRDTLHPYRDAPLSQEDCLVGCFADNTIRKCKCWPPELPYIVDNNDSSNETEGEDQVRWCNWKNESLISQFTDGGKSNLTWQTPFLQCFAGFQAKCSERCKPDCLKSRYQVRVQPLQWPATERILYAPKIQSEALETLRNCCAIVSIRYKTAEETVYTQEKKFEVIEFFSYVGGIISLWLGFSVIGFFDTFKGALDFVVQKYRKRSRGKRSTNTPPEHRSLTPSEPKTLHDYYNKTRQHQDISEPVGPMFRNKYRNRHLPIFTR